MWLYTLTYMGRLRHQHLEEEVIFSLQLQHRKRFLRVYIMKKSSEAEENIHEYIAWVNRNARQKTKRVHTDNAVEFVVLRKGLDKIRVKLTTSTAYSRSQTDLQNTHIVRWWIKHAPCWRELVLRKDCGMKQFWMQHISKIEQPLQSWIGKVRMIYFQGKSEIILTLGHSRARHSFIKINSDVRTNWLIMLKRAYKLEPEVELSMY